MDETTITNWEGNATAPVVRHVPAIIRFLGHNPIATANTFPERLQTLRKCLGLSQRKMADRSGVDPTTVRDWETGRHRPTKKSTRLLDQALAHLDQASGLVANR